ncbi:hypothetical protein PS896_05183 [Pseudomonas fluorescens]|uniref:Protein NO VEIN C-terminal domain-containing protein n=1 Tax=Pseudomonas fluorescens TaxID=294 RepID=A0A5E7PJG7_PSEFL|nr:DUF3883 domain-containing protein [Pseudomonas fluorescens]VVP47443.1 hypothetical protein PS896_05183 [Pseudomonas fluorescens]
MKIWLIPASDDIATQNLSRSMENEIDVNIRQSMLAKALPYKYAWGARLGKNASNRNDFKRMSAGDICFFYTADRREADEPKKAYRWIARILGTTEDQELADDIWPPFGKKPESFPLIYFITPPVKILITTGDISSIISASGKDYHGGPNGFMSVRNENFDYIMGRFGSVERLMSFVLKNFAQEDPLESEYPELFSNLKTDEVKVVFVDDLLAVKKPSLKGKNSRISQRRSKQSKLIGDMAEHFVYHLLLNGGVPSVNASQVEHVADQKLGWDIQYNNEYGDLIRVEVKGSTAPKFNNFELTINELNSLQQHTSNYHFYLVGSCMSESRKVQVITDMASRISGKKATAVPLIFRLELGCV